ncbi:MAG TPA: YqgE/AlgH family protein [Alphaproteobacteria bacterium]|nr:YqgE/AlgH family protein [Alphaproteobacteria bacterium]
MALDKPPLEALYKQSDWLTGQLLIAMPTMPDPRFAHSVIYVCSHGPNGAMGLVVNRLFGEADFESLLRQLNIKPTDETPDLQVHFGGPVETGRGFVLHSSDYLKEGTTRIDDSISLSATIEILQAIADGGGPERAVMALGYTGWGAGQLDAEMKANGWLTAPADDAILFDEEIDTKWERALAKIGISPQMLSGEAGHA